MGMNVYTFDVAAYAVNPTVWSYNLAMVLSALVVLITSLSKFHAFLLTSTSQSNERSAQLEQEITVRQKAEQSKQKTDDKFHRIVDNFQDVYFETDLDGTIFYCTPSCQLLSGYAQEELIGKNATILYHDPNDRQRLLAAVEKAGKARGLEFVFQKKDGSLYDIEFNVDTFFDENGHPKGMSGTIRDVTMTRKAKEQLQRAEKMEAIGLMAGGVAHDLNNIISAIVGYPDLMLMTLSEESELRKPLTAIRESGHRAADIVADLLTVSKGAATAREMHGLHTMIDQYLLSPEYQKVKQLYPQVTCEIAYEASDSIISCSAVHIKKCLMNLVNNAAEAIVGAGTINIATNTQKIDKLFSATHNIKVGTYVVLEINDDGPGIDVRDLEHIFEPFYTKKYLGRSGTGLGLAIVWNTIKNHNAAITVTSSPDGTSFKLYFPLQSSKEAAETSSTDLPQEAYGKGESLLIVDDEAAVRDIASQILSSHGYQVSMVASGEEAVAYLQANTVDLVVLDMLMEPGISGQQTYEQILKSSPDQKALISSGFSENEDVEATLKLGASRFVKKPYSKEQLCNAVRRALDE
ncbi:MAG: response regulator [Halieaceae bacterium]|nr:response regulator [Halieaceae bacterium]